MDQERVREWQRQFFGIAEGDERDIRIAPHVLRRAQVLAAYATMPVAEEARS
jgi:hypothetical protein